MKLHSKTILKAVKENRVVTTSEIAEKYTVSWNTAEKYLLEMALDGSLLRLKKQGVNLWVIK